MWCVCVCDGVLTFQSKATLQRPDLQALDLLTRGLHALILRGCEVQVSATWRVVEGKLGPRSTAIRAGPSLGCVLPELKLGSTHVFLPSSARIGPGLAACDQSQGGLDQTRVACATKSGQQEAGGDHIYSGFDQIEAQFDHIRGRVPATISRLRPQSHSGRV